MIIESISSNANSASVVVKESSKEYLPGPQDDPIYKKAKAVADARVKMEAQKAKETKCRKSKNKPHDQKKNREAKKARKKNR